MSTVLRLLLVGLLFVAQAAFATESLTIAVLAMRDKAEAARKWQPLADYLERTLTGYRITLRVCTFAELDTAIEQRQVDFVFSNPGHYVMMRQGNALSYPLATLIERVGDQPLPVVAGAVIVRAERADIAQLADLKGKTVAITDFQAFGSYQTQAFELFKIGLAVPGDVNLLRLGLPIDRAVMALLEGKADAAFARMGLIDEMAQEGQLDLTRVRVLNARKLPGHGYAYSTPLYPSWPFVAMPQVSESLAARVAAALLMLPHDGQVARAANIWGFSVPANYALVEEVMRALRVPPFDEVPEFSWDDVWQRYPLTVAIALGAGALILLLMFWLAVSRRRLAVERQKVIEFSIEREQYFKFFNTSADLMGIADPQGSFKMINPAFTALLGYSKEEILAKPFLEFVHPDDRQKTLDEVARQLQHGFTLDFENRYVCKDGSIRWLLWRARVNPAEGLTYASARDITERKQIEQVLQAKSEALQRSNTDLEQFAYSVSHDMRQPLRAVSGHLQLLEKALKAVLDEDSRENLAYALEGARRMDSMIVSLLDYSRVGRKTEAKQWMESRQSLDEALGFLAPAIEESGAALEISGEWPHIFASPDELTRLFQNLIGNAIKYHEPDQPPRVEVVSGVMADTWRVSVRDHGIGIDPKQIDRLFHFFSRLQSRARFEGTGMGLALCRRIVEHHHGRIWMESAGEGQGSTFIFEMPLKLSDNSKTAGDRS